MRLLLWGVRVGTPVVKGSPVGGFITLVWRAESELVLRGERHTVLRDVGRMRKRKSDNKRAFEEVEGQVSELKIPTGAAC